MKIGLPKLRLSRKLLIITLGITVLLGGTSAAALYFKSTKFGLESAESTIGGECTDVQTMVLKTPSNRLWLRRFIRMENASGPDRVRTALRVAGLLAKKNAVDLIHVSVLDSHGPTLRSQMRARSIGAEVLIAMKPDSLPEMKSPAMASYYEGPVSDEGRYYGDKVVVDIDEIGAMMTAMRSVEEKPDCVSPEKTEDAEAKPGDHGKKEEKADHGKEEGQEAKGDKSAENHGEETVKDGAEDQSNAEAPAKEQSFFDSMLSMVGLGGGEETATDEETPATDDSHAVAEEPADAAAEDHGEQTAGQHDAKPAEEAEKTAVEGHKPAAKSESHDSAEKSADAAGEHETEPADQAEAEGHKPAGDEEGHDAVAQPADESGDKTATESHEAAEKLVSNHEAVEGAKPVTEGHGAKEAAADHHVHNVSAPAEDEPAALPVDDDGHAAEEKPKVDQHAEVSMPVGD